MPLTSQAEEEAVETLGLRQAQELERRRLVDVEPFVVGDLREEDTTSALASGSPRGRAPSIRSKLPVQRAEELTLPVSMLAKTCGLEQISLTRSKPSAAEQTDIGYAGRHCTVSGRRKARASSPGPRWLVCRFDSLLPPGVSSWLAQSDARARGSCIRDCTAFGRELGSPPLGHPPFFATVRPFWTRSSVDRRHASVDTIVRVAPKSSRVVRTGPCSKRAPRPAGDRRRRWRRSRMLRWRTSTRRESARLRPCLVTSRTSRLLTSSSASKTVLTSLTVVARAFLADQPAAQRGAKAWTRRAPASTWTSSRR